MTKVLTESEVEEITCPGCKAAIQIERKHPTHRIIENEAPEIEGMIDRKLEALKSTIAKEGPEIERIIDLKLEAMKPKVEEKPKEVKEKVKIPGHISHYKCKNCGKIHKNEEFVGPAKGKCDTCGEKFTTRSKGKCPYCKDGDIESLDESDLESMGMYTEEEEHQDHE